MFKNRFLVRFFGKLPLAVLFFSRLVAEPEPGNDPACYAAFVPKRSDDFAWENDRVAFRVYGPALGKSGGDSGIDCWLKRVDYPIIEKWYAEHFAGQSYHVDTGEGFDPYHVGRSRGCGGLALWRDGVPVSSGVFDSWDIIETGPEKVVFKLVYTWELKDETLVETRMTTLARGDQLFSVNSTFTLNGNPVADLPIAIGLTTHDGKATSDHDIEAGWMACWETIKGSGVGTGVTIDPNRIQSIFTTPDTGKDTAHLWCLTTTDKQGTLRYRAGYAWAKADRITSKEEWTEYLAQLNN